MNYSTKTDLQYRENTIAGIYRYPVKGLGGEYLKETEVYQRGIPFDREWMITDPEGNFLTQREIPKMSTISAKVTDNKLIIFTKKEDEHISVPLNADHEHSISKAIIWSRQHEVIPELSKASEWLSDQLGHKIRLVRLSQPKGYQRKIDLSPFDIYIPFTDGYPLLIIGTRSLDDLNMRLEDPVSMDRFRPNLVIVTNEPYVEDQAKKLLINNGSIEIIKPCPRCSVITIDQQNGESGKEPLNKLSSYRKKGNKVYFGMYGSAPDNLLIRTGDYIQFQ